MLAPFSLLKYLYDTPDVVLVVQYRGSSACN